MDEDRYICCRRYSKNKAMSMSNQTMRAVRQRALGASNTLKIVSTEIPILPLNNNHDHTLIKVASSALNRADLLMRSGRYPNQNGRIIPLGLEVAGTDVETNKPVMALLSNGGYSEYVWAPKSQVMPVPSRIPIETASAIPEVWLTAWQLLTFVAQCRIGLPENSTGFVLIHGGASGVGTAASQLAKRVLGYNVISTVSSPKKMIACQKYGADHVINYRETPDWEHKVLELTNERGANVILDCVGGGRHFTQNLNAIAVDGKWVLYGLLGGVKLPTEAQGAPLLAQLLGKRVNLLSTLLNSRTPEYKAELVKDFKRNVLPKLSSGVLEPVVDKVFSFEDVVEAHEYMEKNQNIGKILLKW